MDEQLPRFAAASRRAFLRRAGALGLLGLAPGLACGSDDESTLSNSGDSAEEATTTTAASSSDSSSSDTATSGTRTVEVAFTYEAESGGMIRNPYIAVWAEDADGTLIKTIALWYEAGKGERWLNELSNWYGVNSELTSGGTADGLDAVTSATKAAGTYSVTWDGTDTTGATVADGTYTIFIESNREHGSDSLTSASVTLGGGAKTVTLDDNGELSGASAQVSA